MSRTTTFIVFLAGLIVGSLLSRPVFAQPAQQLVYATFGGAAKVLSATTDGYLNVVAH